MGISLPCSDCNSSEVGADTVEVIRVTGISSRDNKKTPHFNICVRKIVLNIKRLSYFYPPENENIWKETQSTIKRLSVIVIFIQFLVDTI